MLHRGKCVNTRANNLALFYIHYAHSERTRKTDEREGKGLLLTAPWKLSGMRSSVTAIHRDISACLIPKRQNISVFQSQHRKSADQFLCPVNAPIVNHGVMLHE